MLLSRKLGAGYMYVIKLIKKFVCSQFQTHLDELGYLSGLLNVPNSVRLSVISLHSVTRL